ncbi:MAG: hypothetical protein V4820_11920 [Pseudomonadota bacterium]
MEATKQMSLPEGWSNHEGYKAVFLAALQGICANPHFFGAVHQGEPFSAVSFAQAVLSEAIAKTDPPAEDTLSGPQRSEVSPQAPDENPLNPSNRRTNHG